VEPPRRRPPREAEPLAEGQSRTRIVRWDDPAVSAEAAGRLSGLDLLQAIRDGRLPSPPVSRLLGFALTDVEAGRAVFECEPSESHYNPLGSVHGGVLSTLLDSALSCAVHAALPAGQSYTTVELKVNFVRPVVLLTGRLRCEGRVLHVGSRIATAEARLTDGGGTLHAHGVGTCLVLGGR
jgi:uncharacterized protein (TIGR00369 family)